VTKKKKPHVIYADVPSAMKPLPHGPEIPIPKPPDFILSSSSSSTDDSDTVASTTSFMNENQPMPLTQAELNDLTRDLCLSKECSQLLGSRLREKHLLAPETTFYWYREREKEFRQYFTKNDEVSLVYSNNINGLIAALGVDYDPEQWRLFIDSSCRSLKAVLLHNGNRVASVPVGHSVQMSENYNNMDLLLRSLNYSQHNWLICGDLKVSSTLKLLTEIL
jgi:hypothetical protein